MKTTLIKLGVAASAATIATSAFGVTAAQAQSVSFGTDCDFSGAVSCTNVLSGNDSAGDLNGLTGEPSPFDGEVWEFLAKINSEVKDASDVIVIDFNTTPDEGDANAFSIAYDIVDGVQTKASGTWEVFESYVGAVPFVLTMKSGNNHAYNYFDGTVFSGTWNTGRFDDKDMSHITMYVPDDFEPIPTPALLPGLVGMGVAAWRKRKGDAEAAADA